MGAVQGNACVTLGTLSMILSLASAVHVSMLRNPFMLYSSDTLCLYPLATWHMFKILYMLIHICSLCLVYYVTVMSFVLFITHCFHGKVLQMNELLKIS